MPDILSLTGKDLDRELDRIVKTAPQRRKFWTEKEDLVLLRLYKAGVSYPKMIEVLGRSERAIENRLRIIKS